jgi:hypothetical protein
MSDNTKDLKCTAFISYSRADKQWVDIFVNDLKQVTHDVWYDVEIPGGEKWWQEILKQIRENSVFVSLLSLDAVKSIYCRKELSYAIELKKPIIPIWIHQTEDEKNSPNEKLHHLGGLWNEFKDTNVKDIVVQKYMSDVAEGLLISMEIGHDICRLVIKLGTHEIEINLTADKPGEPRYETEEDFLNALEQIEKLMIKDKLIKALELCEKVILDDTDGKFSKAQRMEKEIKKRLEHKKIIKLLEDGLVEAAKSRWDICKDNCYPQNVEDYNEKHRKEVDYFENMLRDKEREIQIAQAQDKIGVFSKANLDEDDDE